MAKKLPDNEIVKDLNEAEDLENVLLYCKNPNKEVMIPIKITDIRDLINRLQAENERLEKEAFTYKIRWAKAEVRETKAKAEAYKEFAEKTNNIIESLIEQYSIKDFEEFKAICQVLRGLKNDTNNLLNELVGDK